MDDLHARSAFAGGSWHARKDVLEFDPIVFSPDITKPVPDIAPQNKRIIRRVAFRVSCLQ